MPFLNVNPSNLDTQMESFFFFFQGPLNSLENALVFLMTQAMR